MALRPLSDRIVLKKDDKKNMTDGGIALPDSAQEKPQYATVVAAGPGRLTEEGNRSPMELNIGDKVIFPKYAGTEVIHDGDIYLIMGDKDILAVVE